MAAKINGSSCNIKKPDELQNSEDGEVHVFSSSAELLETIQKKWDTKNIKPYPAMYSSVYGGIILEPAMMVIPMDDHMVHRGHGVFDTAAICDGFLYELDEHLERFHRSASKAKITSPFPLPTLRSILIQLAAVSECKNGSLRYWLSSGPGNFSLTPGKSATSAFYAIVIAEDNVRYTKGFKVITTSIPMKSPIFAEIKSVNYLPNVLARMEAEAKGALASIWVDEQGYVGEGPNMNVAFITKEKELVLPCFDRILRGCTALRLLELAPRLVEQGKLKGVKVANISAVEAKEASEMMYVGSGWPIGPIVMWDDKPIGDGNVGELTLSLLDLLWEDLKAGPESKRIQIPYRE
ncbi:transaminase [Lithospermum erythrorhizon]|uniref:Transaminase n=1 Tax=Lithospermum erythrorhizon TaxID=34254 RepID=A0AAV3PRB5_LITER